MTFFSTPPLHYHFFSAHCLYKWQSPGRGPPFALSRVKKATPVDLLVICQRRTRDHTMWPPCDHATWLFPGRLDPRARMNAPSASPLDGVWRGAIRQDKMGHFRWRFRFVRTTIGIWGWNEACKTRVKSCWPRGILSGMGLPRPTLGLALTNQNLEQFKFSPALYGNADVTSSVLFNAR